MLHSLRWILAPLACLVLGACANLSFERDTQSSGTFSSSGWSFTLFSVDLPKSALNIARENAADANLPHLVVKEVTVIPHFGPLDFLMDFFSFRYARIHGTWGHPLEPRSEARPEAAARQPTQESS